MFIHPICLAHFAVLWYIGLTENKAVTAMCAKKRPSQCAISVQPAKKCAMQLALDELAAERSRDEV